MDNNQAVLMSDWRIDEIAGLCAGSVLNAPRSEIRGFSIDTRTISDGDAFVAIKGDRFDGHDYIPQALAKRIPAILASRFPPGAVASRQTACILVEDPLRALQDLARFQRSRHKGLFLGVTGSNGKTTTKEMLRHIFSEKSDTWATSGNLNNHIGLPLNLVRIPLKTKVAIVEMGMNHPGEIRFLADISKPQTAVITNVGPAHIGILGSLENIALAKSEILSGLPPDAFGVVDGDSEFLPLFKKTCPARLVTFGFGANCEMRGCDLLMLADGVRFNAIWGSEKAKVDLPLLGKHNAMNALAALAVFVSQGHPLAAGAERLASFPPVGARMESHLVDGVRVILDCYNANPASMLQAVDFLRICPGKRVAVLGEMRELGEDSPRFHAQVGSAVAKAGIDVLVAVGEQARLIADGAKSQGMHAEVVHFFPTSGEAIGLIETLLKEKTTILLKASRGMHFESITRVVWPSLPCDLH